VVLQKEVEMSTTTTTVTGGVVFTWTEKDVSATIDLGSGLGPHTFTFQRN